MASTSVGNGLVHGTSAVKMYQEKGFAAWCDGPLHEEIVNLKRRIIGFYQYGFQPVFGDGEDGSDVGVGRNEDFVAVFQLSHFLISPEDEGQSVEPVAASHAMTASDVGRVFVF